MGLSYQLSPRTQVGIDVEENRSSNIYQAGYNTTASASFGRKMGMHWFLSLNGGGSMSEITSASYGTPRTKDVIGGGSIGFRTYQHTLLGSYSRSASDAYGLALGTTTTTSAAWNWHRPGSRWSWLASFGQQQIRDTGYTSLSGWQASGGVSQTLNAHMRMSAQYVYLSNSGSFLGNNTKLAIQSVRVSLSWTPQEYGTRH
jgi:opacity protein-like surface antigen